MERIVELNNRYAENNIHTNLLLQNYEYFALISQVYSAKNHWINSLTLNLVVKYTRLFSDSDFLNFSDSWKVIFCWDFLLVSHTLIFDTDINDIAFKNHNKSTNSMEICNFCCDSSKNAFQNVETVQIGDEFIAISEMTKVFRDLESVIDIMDL